MKIKLHVDNKQYTEKPNSKMMGGIRNRLQKNSTPCYISIRSLANKLQSGYTICPAVVTGTTNSDWQEQQLFMVDIDNADTSQPILTIKEAINICKTHGLPVSFYYHTFNSSRENPKFRLVFVMDSPVTNESCRSLIISALVSLFPQADIACTDASRIFLGTNKTVRILNENASITLEQILDTYSLASLEEHASEQIYPVEASTNSELDSLKQSFDFLSYLALQNGPYIDLGNTVLFENCTICGHKHNLVLFKGTNTFYCFSPHGQRGGSIIDYLMVAENLSLPEAIHKFKNELVKKEKQQQWKEPIPFEEVNLPAFPINSLPDSLKQYVTAVSESTATPVDMAAICALAMVSTAVQSKFSILGKDDYSESLNLYTLIVANPAERKSAVVRAMTDVVHRYEREQNKKRASQIKEEEIQLEVLRAEYNNSKNLSFEQRLKLKNLEENKTTLLRLIADDITPEALTSLLADNHGKLTVISTEGGLFDTLAGRYSKSNSVSIDTVLKAHCADPIKVDRKGREHEEIEQPTLTMLLAAQDGVLNDILNNQTFSARGLVARFLYTRPPSPIGTRSYQTPKIPLEAKDSYENLLLKLLEIPYPSLDGIKKITLSQEAALKSERFFNWLEPQLRDQLSPIVGWAGKLSGTCLRIAGLLHCVLKKDNADKVPVSAKTMAHAIKISIYFLKHAQYIFMMMGADKVSAQAKFLLKRLEQQGNNELTKYQMHRLGRGMFPKTNDVIPALNLLVEHGYLQEIHHISPTGGRPRDCTYLLNPLHFDIL